VFAETKEGIYRNKDKKLALKIHEEREIKRRTASHAASKTSGCMKLRAPVIETMTRRGLSSWRRRVRRVVGDGMELLLHDGEVDGVVVDDDTALVLFIRGSARYAQAHVPNRRSHHRVPLFHECIRAGCRDMRTASLLLSGKPSRGP